jgi:mannose-1-phosphate guanylyltransferase
VDHGVLEKSDRVAVIPCSFAWDDLGSFASLARHGEKDEEGNAAVGNILALDAKNCITMADEGHLTTLLGVSDLIVVHANGVTLVAPRHRAEEVRRLVAELETRGLDRFA